MDELAPQNEHLRAALGYAKRGWPVLPLRGKAPRVNGAYKAASTDPGRIKSWWAKWPDANIGIRTGSESGMVVLDIDPRHGGNDSLAALVEEHGELPVTPEVATGGGGSHFYFESLEGLGKRKDLVKGLDFLSDGAYVVAPPSRHHSGEPYEWVDGRHPTDVALAPLPQWIVDLANRPPVSSHRSLEKLLAELGDLPEDATPWDIGSWLDAVARLVVSGSVQGQFQLFRQAVMSKLKAVSLVTSPAAIFDEAVTQIERSDPADEEAPRDREITEELRAKALSLLEQPALLDLADGSIYQLGLLGEPINRRMVFLAGVSGHLGAPFHLVVHGPSAGGKNELVRCALGLLPPDRVLVVTGMSTHALEFRGGRIEGVLVIVEAEGQRDAEYQLRVAMSEGTISRLTVGRDEDGVLVGEERVVEVAASIITTTTEPALHEENQTRVFDLWIDDSESLTAEILQAYADRAEGHDADRTTELEELWHAAIGLLEPERVVIPYAGILAESFPTSPLRARRDFQRVIALINACALLYQVQRQRDRFGRVIAEVRDYAAVLPLVQKVLGPTMMGLSDKALDLCHLQKELEEPLAQRWVRRIDLETEAGRRRIASAATVHKWSKRLREMGFWEGEKERGAWRHRTLRDPEQNAIPLPTKEELEQSLMERAESRAMSHKPKADGTNQEAHSDE